MFYIRSDYTDLTNSEFLTRLSYPPAYKTCQTTSTADFKSDQISLNHEINLIILNLAGLENYPKLFSSQLFGTHKFSVICLSQSPHIGLNPGGVVWLDDSWASPIFLIAS